MLIKEANFLKSICFYEMLISFISEFTIKISSKNFTFATNTFHVTMHVIYRNLVIFFMLNNSLRKKMIAGSIASRFIIIS